MAAALLEPLVARAQVAELRVRRTDICFHNVRSGRVRVAVRVWNVGNCRSEPDVMWLQAAPLGAFVAWQDVTSAAVPAIEPGESVEIVTEVDAPPATGTRGEFSRVPPHQLLTAVAAGDDDDQPSPGDPGQAFGDALRNLLGRPTRRQRRDDRQGGQELPDDPLSLLRRGSFHWAGNINVLLGGQAVERHMAQALRIYPGKTNLAMFFVGDRPDEYQFALSGSGSAWQAGLYDSGDLAGFYKRDFPSQSLPLSQWITLSRRRMVFLAVLPPEECERGSLDVHVRQRSTGREAVVEFSLDPRAAGAGCYTV